MSDHRTTEAPDQGTVTPASPLPWRWHPRSAKAEHEGSIYRMERPGHAYAIAMQPRYVENKQFSADAAFIVRAVNSHDALVSALHEAKAQIEYLHDKFAKTGTGNAVIARIDAALALTSTHGN